MFANEKVLIGKDGDKEFYLLPKMANRHGVIAGGTGSGKTITLKVLAESFSNMGVPVFLADVKGDLAGMCVKGDDTEDMKKRIEKFGLKDYGFDYKAFPTSFFDVNRKKGLPIRTTISDFGPVLLSHVLGLNQVQSDILNVIFKIADDNGLLLLDLKDLKKMLDFVNEHAKDFSKEYGNIPAASLQTILRGIMSLETEGLDNLFGEPMLDINDLLKTNEKGQGFINILHSEMLINQPRVYGALLLWLLSEFYENMPEVGDLPKPKVVFFFDEAHLLFNNASKILLEKITQVTKLIRSKGIGLYFISQSPTDIPDSVLSQLGNKIQHVHRAYSANDRKNLKAIVDGFRENKELNLSDTIESLGTGEAVVSLLDEKGAPSIAAFAKILPPESKMGTIDDSVRDEVVKGSILYGKYGKDIDRDSAYEMLNNDAVRLMKEQQLGFENEGPKANRKALDNDNDNIEYEEESPKKATKTTAKKSKSEKQLASATKSVAKSTGSTVGREIGRALASSIFGSKSTIAKNIGGNIGSALGRNALGTLTSFMG